MPSKVSFKGVATKVRKAILKSKKKVSLTPQQLKLLRQSHKPPRMSDNEKGIIREQAQEGMEPVDIAGLLGRDLSTITRFLGQKKQPNPIGRPQELTSGHVDKIVEVLESMVDKADGEEEVTLPMVMRRAKTKFCDRTIADALQKRGYWFRKLRNKMILTPEDVKERFKWSKVYRQKGRKFWYRKVKISLDNHHFKVALTPKGRKLLAKRGVTRVYRKKGITLRAAHTVGGKRVATKPCKCIRSGHVKPSPKLRLTGTRQSACLQDGDLAMEWCKSSRALHQHSRPCTSQTLPEG